MDNFSRRGSTVAGFVGVLSLVLLVGITSFGLYSYDSSRTSNRIEAGESVADVDLGLTIDSPAPLKVSWVGPMAPDSNATYVVEVGRSDGSDVDGNTTRILDGNVKTVSFSSLTLQKGQYTVKLKYTPSSGPVLVDEIGFVIDQSPASK